MRYEYTSDCQQIAEKQQNYKNAEATHASQAHTHDFSNMKCAKEVPNNAEEVQHENHRNNKATLGADNNEPSVRLLRIRKSVTGSCGFNLTRTKWDPYPWVSAVDAHTAAEMSGLQAGDCVLEVNGEDVLGQRITDIAKLVQAKSGHVTLLIWNCGSDFKCDPESICCAPMPRTLQRLATIVQSVLTIIECPVCMDTITPPAMQCQNGHLLCLNCRIRAEKCPVCRDRYTPQRALIAEQIYTAITGAYNLCSTNEDKLRQKLFGEGAQVMSRRLRRAEAAKQSIGEERVQAKKRWRRRQTQTTKEEQCQSQDVAPGGGQPGHFRFRTETETATIDRGAEAAVTAPNAEGSACGSAVKRESSRKKILMKLWRGKAASMENLSTSLAEETKTTRNGQLSSSLIGAGGGVNGLACADGATTPATGITVRAACPTRTLQLSSNRSVNNAIEDVERVLKDSQNHSTLSENNCAGTLGSDEGITTTATTTITEIPARTQTMTMPLNCTTAKKTILNSTATNDVAHVNAMSKLLSATTPTTNDLSAQPQHGATFQQQQKPAGEKRQLAEEEEAGEARNGKNSPQLILSTWQQQQQQQKYLTGCSKCVGVAEALTYPPPTPPPGNINAVKRCPSWQRSPQPPQSVFASHNNSNYENCSCPSSALRSVDQRRSSGHTLSRSIEYLNKSCWQIATASLSPTMNLKMCCNSNSTNSRKSSSTSTSSSSSSSSNGSSNNNSSCNSSSDIVDSSHSILTPASSISSGVFSSSLDPNDLAATVEQHRRQQRHTKITTITVNKNALLSPVTSLGQPSSITSSLRSLSSLASSSFSSASASDESSLPSMADVPAEAYQPAAATSINSSFSSDPPSAAVMTLTSSVSSLSSTPSDLSHSKSTSLCRESRQAATHYRCPYDGCNGIFNASSLLQRHVKVAHRLPILSFGGEEGAHIAVPLSQPVADAVLILEACKNESTNNSNSSSNNNNQHYNNENNNNTSTSNCNEDNAFSDACGRAAHKRSSVNYDDGESYAIDSQDAHKGVEKASRHTAEEAHSKHIEKQLEQTRECWIRLKAHDNSIHATALLQATAAESADYVLKMRLNGIGDTTLVPGKEAQMVAIELQLIYNSGRRCQHQSQHNGRQAAPWPNPKEPQQNSDSHYNNKHKRHQSATTTTTTTIQ